MTGNTAISGANYYMKSSGYNYQSTRTESNTTNVSFANKLEVAGTATSRSQHVETSAVDDYIKRHPDNKYQIERFVNAGNKVLSQYGRDDVDAMSMDEYKEYIYGVLDKIPFDASQMRDTQFIDITEDGWEQMKNDPKYEAWVVGYFKVDRSVKNPFANYPGVSPRIHTEHFGASIDEHLGQSYPESMSTGDEKDSEDWWKKRKDRFEKYIEETQEENRQKAIARNKNHHKATEQRIVTNGVANVSGEFEGVEGTGMSAAAGFFAMMTQGQKGTAGK